MENEYKNMTKEELEAEATKILDEIDEETKERLKEAFINLLLFGKAEFEYKPKPSN